MSDGASAPTPVRRQAITTADPDEAAARLARAYPGLRVGARQEDRPFEFDYRNLATERFTINRMRCSGVLRATGPLPESVAVGRRCAGTVGITRGDRSIDTSAPYLRPVAPSEIEVRDAEVNLVTVAPSSLTEYVERSGERRSTVTRLKSRPALTGWRLVMDHAVGFLDDPALLDRPAAEDELHDLLCWSLLQAFEDPWAESRRWDARSTALRRALRYLDEHADGKVTMPEVAAAARVSLRTLGLLFRRELDTTPLRWLHDLRLDRTRLDLLEGDATVAEIASRHGLTHSGRFAAEYRARFGESPLATLRGT